MSKGFYETPSHSDCYAQCRPTYPVELIKNILTYLSAKHTINDDDIAIDIGCGTGQSTILLQPYFQQIIGYDISESQIWKANENNAFSNISYKTIVEGDIPHRDSSLTLIISGQAAHWLDLPHFYKEVQRTLKTNGVLALFGYAFIHIDGQYSEKLNQILQNFYHRTLNGYVQKESQEVYFGRYRDEKFHIPLSATNFTRDDSLAIKCQWSIRRLLGYMASMSGCQYFLKENPNSTILDDLQAEIFQCLNISDDAHEICLSFDIFLLMNRKNELDPNRCQYLCPRKQRQCKMAPSAPLSTHCMEHIIYDPDLDETTKQSLRVPCPLNPLHSISPHGLKRHLKKCNKRLIILGPFHRPQCNSGLECDNHDDYPSILQDITDDELRDFVARMESIHDNLVKEPLQNNSNQPECHLSDKNLEELGNRSRKHLEQIGSIIAQLVQLNLLQSNTCFVEMGAGRGQLAHELHACLKDDSTIHFALIERDHQRYRYDAHHRREHQGPSFERYRLDIRDLYLSELPSIENPQTNIVIISKHLCGGATDLALRSAVDAQRNTHRVQAIIIALCCHHRLLWNDYIGKEFFRHVNLTPKDFSLIRTLTSWGTCDNRHRMPQDGKRSTNDGTLFQPTPSLLAPEDRSNYSKQRLFSVEHQEQIGVKAKRLLDWGRIQYLNANGFNSHLKVFMVIIHT
ncbi:unnamed protein product [Adineta ricciae]|uniref:tRNA:m(4)X modification enzyme TRM13 n=1 Tax=Adineta ricciae TaxID=249248 RepID=A0A813VT98_ADIRI|nr:unnamed protein product [Adineta ricciae]